MSESKKPITKVDASIVETPYPFQVAGHGALLRLPGGKICKPFIEIEYNFYEGLPSTAPTLVPFTPNYYGIIDMQFSKQKIDEWVDFMETEQIKHQAAKSETGTPSSPTKTTTTSPSEYSAKYSGIDQRHADKEEYRNPWSLKIGKDNLNSLLEKGQFTRSILLLLGVLLRNRCLLVVGVTRCC
jgi:hypothetical protein